MKLRIFALLCLFLFHWMAPGSAAAAEEPPAKAPESPAERSAMLKRLQQRSDPYKVWRLRLDASVVDPVRLLQDLRQEAAAEQVQALQLELSYFPNDCVQAQRACTTLRSFPVPVLILVDGELQGAACLLAIAGDHLALSPAAAFRPQKPQLYVNATALDLDGADQLQLQQQARLWATDLAHATGRDAALLQLFVDPQARLEVAGTSLGGEAWLLDAPAAALLFDASSVRDGAAMLERLQLKQAQPLLRVESSALWLADALRSWLPLLWLLCIAGIIIEMKTPGFGLGGSLGLGILALCLVLQWLLGLANLLDVGLVSLGLALIAVEIFLTPGVSIPGLLGICSLLCGMALSFIDFEALPQDALLRKAALWAAASMAARSMVLIALGAIALLFIAFMITGRFGKHRPREVAEQRLEEENALVQGIVPARMLHGLEGVAHTDLHPVGQADLCGYRLDVSSRSGIIEKGRRVRVVTVEGNRILVQELPDV